MQSYFIAKTMSGIKTRVDAKNIDNLRRNLIQDFPKDKDWSVIVFDYRQNFLGELFFYGVAGQPVLWGQDGSWIAKKVSSKTRRLM